MIVIYHLIDFSVYDNIILKFKKKKMKINIETQYADIRPTPLCLFSTVKFFNPRT